MTKVNTIYGQGIIADFNEDYATIYLDVPVAFYSDRYGRTLLEDVITLSVDDPSIRFAIDTLLEEQEEALYDEQVQAMVEAMLNTDIEITL